MKKFDICVIGHITKDIIRIDGQVKKELPGGTAYYTAIALKTLGLQVAVITKTAKQDQEYLISDLTAKGITVFWQASQETSIFEDIYQSDNLDIRSEKVWAIADPFQPEDLREIAAKVFHIGPLTQGDIVDDFWPAIAAKSGLISLDGQGLIRQVTVAATVEDIRGANLEKLRGIHILKVDEKEAKVLSGETDWEKAAIRFHQLGPQEIIITFGSQGSWIYSQGKFHHIPAASPKKAVDATGCGDTYMAGYLYRRLQSENITAAGKFAAKVAALKLEKFGPLSAWDGTF